jgi:hypothetical protein
MAQLLANIPWWFTLFLIFAGALAVYYGNRRIDTRTRSAGLLVVSLAMLLGAARFLIDTPAEMVERRTRQIVDCCDKQDWPRLAGLLDADTQLDVSGKEHELAVANMNFRGADNVTKDAQAAAEAAKLKAIQIMSLKTEPVEGMITVTFGVYTVQDSTQGQPFPSSWEFDYFPSGSRWDLRTIKLTSWGNETLQ